MTTTSVAFLRAVNVGGRSLPMVELRALFERLGAQHIATYIQSGNVIFDPPTGTTTRFAEIIERALYDEFGLHSAVVARSANELRRVLSSIPFPTDAHPLVHVGLFKSRPPASELEDVSSFDAGEERVIVDGKECFLYLPNGVGRAKLPARLNRLSTPVTIRNLRTLAALEEFASSRGSRRG